MRANLLFLLVWMTAGFASAAETVSFPSLDQAYTGGAPTMLKGFLVKPEGKGEGPFPAMVMLHGCGGLIDAKTGLPEARSTWWADYFQQQGYVALMVESFRSRGATQYCPKAAPTVAADRERPLDAYAALKYLQQQKFVKPGKIGLIGWSHGGGTVLYTIDAQSAARPDGLQHDFAAAIAFYPGRCSLSEQRPDWRSAAPLLVLMGESDNWTLARPCRVFIEASRERGNQSEIVLYENTYHDFDWPGTSMRTIRLSGSTVSHTLAPNQASWDDAKKRVLDFLGRYLKD